MAVSSEVARRSPLRLMKVCLRTLASNRQGGGKAGGAAMHTMSDEERWRFLTERARTMMVGTVRPDGRAHIAPVWFELDGDSIVFTTGNRSAKAQDLRRDPRVSLCVDDEAPPFTYVIIEGTATLSADRDALLRWATRIGGKYMGADQAEAIGKRNAVEGELLVRVAPSKIIARAGIAD
jgi:PPOX class probable F420-dependent enzyme